MRRYLIVLLSALALILSGTVAASSPASADGLGTNCAYIPVSYNSTIVGAQTCVDWNEYTGVGLFAKARVWNPAWSSGGTGGAIWANVWYPGHPVGTQLGRIDPGQTKAAAQVSYGAPYPTGSVHFEVYVQLDNTTSCTYVYMRSITSHVTKYGEKCPNT